VATSMRHGLMMMPFAPRKAPFDGVSRGGPRETFSTLPRRAARPGMARRARAPMPNARASWSENARFITRSETSCIQTTFYCTSFSSPRPRTPPRGAGRDPLRLRRRGAYARFAITLTIGIPPDDTSTRRHLNLYSSTDAHTEPQRERARAAAAHRGGDAFAAAAISLYLSPDPSSLVSVCRLCASHGAARRGPNPIPKPNPNPAHRRRRPRLSPPPRRRT